MRHIRNLLYFCIGFLLISFVMIGSAKAEAPETWYSLIYGSNTYVNKNPASNCSLLPNPPGYTLVEVGSPVQYYCRRPDSYQIYNTPVSKCADGTAPNTSLPLNQQCPDSCPVAGTASGDNEIIVAWGTGPSPNSPYATTQIHPGGTVYSDGTCGITIGNVKSCSRDQEPSTNGYYAIKCVFGGTYTGSTAPVGSPTDPALNQAAPTVPSTGKDNCPPGTVSGGIDKAGIPICMGTGTSPSNTSTSQQPPTTTQNPDGSTTTTQTSTKTNADGSTTTTTTTTTTRADGSTTTSVSSTTSNAPNGLPGKDDPQPNDFCKQNPQLTICKNSMVKGECENTECEGDAITCSILRQQRRQYCENVKPTALSDAGNAIINGNDPLAGSLPSPNNSNLYVSASSLDQSGFLGSSCLSDKSFNFQGQAITIEFSKVCDSLIPFRAGIMAVAGLVSLALISKPIMG